MAQSNLRPNLYTTQPIFSLNWGKDIFTLSTTVHDQTGDLNRPNKPDMSSSEAFSIVPPSRLRRGLFPEVGETYPCCSQTPASPGVPAGRTTPTCRPVMSPQLAHRIPRASANVHASRPPTRWRDCHSGTQVCPGQPTCSAPSAHAAIRRCPSDL